MHITLSHLLAALVLSVGPAATDAEDKAPQAAPQPLTATSVFLVRHAEKTAERPDPKLTAAGQARSERLAHVLAEAGIDTVFSTPFERTRRTAGPVAAALGLEVRIVEVGEGFAESLAERIRHDHAGGTVLVVGHSNTTPAVIDALGAGPAPAIAEHEYDDLFLVVLPSEGEPRLYHLGYGEPTP